MRETASDRVFAFFNHVFIGLLLIIILYPLIYIISASISDPVMVNSGQMWLLPKKITIDGYMRVFENREIWNGYVNTVIYTVLGTLLNLLITLPCAYALSRKGVVGRNIVMALLVFTMFFSGGLIPSFLLVKGLGILDSIWAMLLPNAVAVWNIIVTRTYFQISIPNEMLEAGEIDGCSPFRLFLSLVLPVSKPIIAVMALFYGVGHWNQYFNAMLYLSDRDLFPLQLILREILILEEMSVSMLLNGSGDLEAMAEQARVADIVKYAVMIVSMLPLLIVYPFLQRYFVKGFLIGSLKG
ncbi:carbohydrate ABC transporter permease [Paenibacillus sp. J5C_2022]|uniref:carbohydrate ABC transporter permease n=1 Tax=Paenibacillus sp. J5C2022 TaxID=2977129 RepID=UPI0021CF0E57|nr:carbohydrate ABC transporter permease [Paenibacillus sp. J5C2022]MCU6707866.1 carbohydrate ABC transporter permease [Paenibacillus sp. J5C2022]